MKYRATTIPESERWKWCETYSSAAKTPNAMKLVFTTRVPARPKNFPAMNSQRLTGRDNTVYSVRLSISFETSPIPIKMAITIPNSVTAVSPRLITTRRSMFTEICPTSTAHPVISKSKAIRLYRTRSRTASRKVFVEI